MWILLRVFMFLLWFRVLITSYNKRRRYAKLRAVYYYQTVIFRIYNSLFTFCSDYPRNNHFIALLSLICCNVNTLHRLDQEFDHKSKLRLVSSPVHPTHCPTISLYLHVFCYLHLPWLAWLLCSDRMKREGQ